MLGVHAHEWLLHCSSSDLEPKRIELLELLQAERLVGSARRMGRPFNNVATEWTAKVEGKPYLSDSFVYQLVGECLGEERGQELSELLQTSR